MSPASARKSPQRIISLAPSVTSILLALGARRQLVAVSRWCKDVADVSGLPALGDCWSLTNNAGGNARGNARSRAGGNAERKRAAENRAEEGAAALLKLKPTLIIGSVPFKTETVQQILAVPVPFLALNPRRLADVAADIRVLGRVANATARAEALIGEMRRRFESVRKIASRARIRPSVYCEAWPNPRISSPPWVEELVEICGGEMCVPVGARITDEDVARANPEIIVLAWTAVGGNSKPEQAIANPVWKDVAAVRERRVFAIRDELLNTPGPPLMRGAGELLRVIHPELTVPAGEHRDSARAAAT